MLGHSLQRRVEGLVVRADALRGLRSLVGLPPGQDITERQWRVLESQLGVAASSLRSQVTGAARVLLAHAGDERAARRLNTALGQLELDLARNFTFFDTYMDVLTQRLTPELGGLLSGCDALAWDALHRDHPALWVLEPPLVFCDRGFGASIVREGVRLPRLPANPLPLIQIPYARLHEKYNLTSVLHEVGHQALTQLRLVQPVREAIRRAVSRSDNELASWYALWSSEIGPDFWTFGLAGSAGAASLRELFALPLDQVVQVSPHDPHPPMYLRVLLAFEWCRQVWGRGPWDRWEREWRTLYPLAAAPPRLARLMERGCAQLPRVSRVLLETRFRSLDGRTLPSLLDLRTMHPVRLERVARRTREGRLDLRGLAPCAQLAVFRMVRDQGQVGVEELDSMMARWLSNLARQRPYATTGVTVASGSLMAVAGHA
jgi:hypothetical protein